MKAEIRKIVVVVEETRREMGRDVNPATRKAVAAAVIRNPFAGAYAEDLEPLMAIGEELGGLLGERAVAALGVKPGQIESYGKGAIVGEKGEWEHAAAILHPRLGKPLRAAVEKGAVNVGLFVSVDRAEDDPFRLERDGLFQRLSPAARSSLAVDQNELPANDLGRLFGTATDAQCTSIGLIRRHIDDCLVEPGARAGRRPVPWNVGP